MKVGLVDVLSYDTSEIDFYIRSIHLPLKQPSSIYARS